MLECRWQVDPARPPLLMRVWSTAPPVNGTPSPQVMDGVHLNHLCLVRAANPDGRRLTREKGRTNEIKTKKRG
jgi:hypothetical protein